MYENVISTERQNRQATSSNPELKPRPVVLMAVLQSIPKLKLLSRDAISAPWAAAAFSCILFYLSGEVWTRINMESVLGGPGYRFCSRSCITLPNNVIIKTFSWYKHNVTNSRAWEPNEASNMRVWNVNHLSLTIFTIIKWDLEI